MQIEVRLQQTREPDWAFQAIIMLNSKEIARDLVLAPIGALGFLKDLLVHYERDFEDALEAEVNE